LRPEGGGLGADGNFSQQRRKENRKKEARKKERRCHKFKAEAEASISRSRRGQKFWF